MIPGHRPVGQDNGRASGGLAQLSRRDIAIKKDRVVTRNYRIQGQILNLPSGRLLWLNTYFPTDPQLVGEYDDSVLQEVLAEVECIVNQTDFTDIVWGSDLNWDMDRKTYFAARVREFVDRLGLEPVWSHHPVDYTHIHTENKSTATLDHFLISPRLLPLVVSSGALHRGDNFSRHSPIWLSLKLGSLPVKDSTKKTFVPRRPAWSKASQDDIHQFTSDLQDKLMSTHASPSMQCHDPHCKEQAHSQERDDMMLDILCKIVECSTVHTQIYL